MTEIGKDSRYEREIKEKDFIIEDLQAKYNECLETLNAIRSGDVDAVVVQGILGDKIYTLKDAEHTYRIMVENMNEGAATVSPDGFIYYCNSKLADMLGISLEKAIGSNIKSFIKRSNHPGFKSFLLKARQGEGKVEVEIKPGKDRKDGEEKYIPVLVSGRSLAQEGRKLLILIMADLTEYRQKEKILKSEWFSRTILDQAAEIILVTDPEGIVLRASRQALSLIEKQNTVSLVGSHIDSFFKNFYLIKDNEIKKQKKKFEYPVDFSIITKNNIRSGSKLGFFEGRITRSFLINHNIIQEDGEKIGFFISLIEISKLKKAEEQIKRYAIKLTAAIEEHAAINEELAATNEELETTNEELLTSNEELATVSKELNAVNQELERANKELEAFSYSASHDLRAPIRSIDSFSQIIINEYEDKLDDVAKDYLNRIRQSSQKLSKLLDGMQKLFRVTKAELNMKRLNLSNIVYLIADILKQTNPEKKIDFDIEEDIIALADEDLLKIALTNLLENSLKFTANKEKALIEFGMIKNVKFIYYVRDNGIGFDMQFKDKLFTPFNRYHTEKDIPGTGIGLSIVDRIIKRHGGKIWAEGEKNKGATFFFTLGTEK